MPEGSCRFAVEPQYLLTGKSIGFALAQFRKPYPIRAGTLIARQSSGASFIQQQSDLDELTVICRAIDHLPCFAERV